MAMKGKVLTLGIALMVVATGCSDGSQPERAVIQAVHSAGQTQASGPHPRPVRTHPDVVNGSRSDNTPDETDVVSLYTIDAWPVEEVGQHEDPCEGVLRPQPGFENARHIGRSLNPELVTSVFDPESERDAQHLGGPLDPESAIDSLTRDLAIVREDLGEAIFPEDDP